MSKPNLDQSLYARSKSAATRAAVDAVNAEAWRVLPSRIMENAWGSLTTLRRKVEYLEAFKAGAGLPPSNWPFLEPEQPKAKMVRNLMSGNEIEIATDTPLCCDPSSETYWSM